MLDFLQGSNFLYPQILQVELVHQKLFSVALHFFNPVWSKSTLLHGLLLLFYSFVLYLLVSLLLERVKSLI